MKKIAYVAVTCVLLSACGQARQPMAPAPEPVTRQAPAPSHPAHAHAEWKGKWVGVEGMFLIITPTSPGNYDLEMKSDLDTHVRVKGVDSGSVIAFQRNGQRFTLRPSNGSQTGLKWLDGEKNCLMVQKGEGYCR